jgi:methionine-rich copper-binding protein CopC
MAVNKNFVVKNGLEVKTDLILADTTKNSVGIGTSGINYKLHVYGGIGATSIYVSGASTVASISGTNATYTTGNFTTNNSTTLNATTGNIVSGVVTSLSGSTLNYSGIASVGSLRIGSDEVVSSARQLKNIASLDATTTATIEAAIANGPNTFTDLTVVGISTLGTVLVSDGTITATSGIVTYYGDGSKLTGIATAGGEVTLGLTTITQLNVTGIASLTNLTVSGVSTFGNIILNPVGIITAASGIITYYGDAQYLQNLPTSIPGGSDTQVQYNSGNSFAGSSNFTFNGNNVVVGSAVTLNSSGINVSGVITSRSSRVGSATTFGEDLVVQGNARVTGILTVGTSSVTINGVSDQINVGSAATINSSGASFAGVVTATSFSGSGGFNLGISSAGTPITTGPITTLNFVGTGNTFALNGTTVDISISGGGGSGIGSTASINTTGIITASKIVANEFIGTGDKLIFSPIPTSFSPTDGTTGVNAFSSPNIFITYDQPILAGVGTITLRKGSPSGSIAESFTVGVSTRVSISNQTLIIDPTDNLDYDQEYYTVVPQGAVTNYVDGNNYLLDGYNFTTETGPTVSSFSPANNSTSNSVTSNIVITFNKNVRSGVGTITLRSGSSTGTIVESYNVASSPRLTFSTNTLTIDPTSNLSSATVYFVVIPSGAVAGYSGTNTYNFTTAPSLVSRTPSDSSVNQTVTTNITLTFDAPPIRGTGTITLRRDSTSGTILESYDAASSGRISVSGNNWILDPSITLPYKKFIYLVLPSTAISGFDGLNVGGSSLSYTFETQTPVLGSSYEGGFAICTTGGTAWVVAPSSSEVSRFQTPAISDAPTRAQQVSGCTGWFLPTLTQLQNPGYQCRVYWDTYSLTTYWSSTQGGRGHYVNMSTGASSNRHATITMCARAFRCVTY